MAKKRKKQKKEEEEKYEFVPPEFDEKQFLLDEMSATKRVLLIVGFGVLIGALAGVLTIITANGLFGLVMLIVGFGSMKMLFIWMKFDLSKFKRRTWLENSAWFFFTFLAVWILVINPPFVDFASPEIKNVKLAVTVPGVGVVNYNYTLANNTYSWQTGKYNMTVSAALQAAYLDHTAVNISAHIADNERLSEVPTISFRPDSPTVLPSQMSLAGGSRYYYSIASFGGTYLKDGHYFSFRMTAIDPAQHITFFVPASTAEVIVVQ